MADDGRPLDPDDFDATQVAHDPAMRALESGATELLPSIPRTRTRRSTRTVTTGGPRRGFEPAWWMALVAVLFVVAAIVAALALTDDDDDVEPAISATSVVVPTSEFVAPTTTPVVTPPSDATTTTPPTTTEPPPPGPTIVSFTGPETVTCTEPTDIELSWETTGATNVTLARDRTIIATVEPSGSELVEYPCDGEPHSYVVTAANDDGQVSQQQLTVSPG
ncbi:MAG TPA: hypothetical protein VFZ83_03055 [Acidimicrobiia bacterium]|nr:hypothetical protein [Acidimicrobiia bacterium]